ncbi:alkyl hydroperoxide reductase/ Thiol specific antioxidant/ Mal allergen [Halorhabdus utahensis DSM 12940]|uniref:Alkyl hydroperoxide reductase/ Thiol specific antioxidant/ Mal allergen n=1 Tax=Halorhabdus utahensis (strain DSM 12940 / JCM 11049 / AX-2) TaxID=519442 RepID=C7NUC4_HALUD|nr:redoxin domain-containing protein [Halorhabdus utahensis]ACV11021.1 alkyl hydroperoxide reductase/ Thiol specific antioxidant/ Mal allergen [Halorhabdus utahensis DSM 12940]
MSETTLAEGVFDFELPNVGVGPDPLGLDAVVAASDFAVLLFLRDYHCPKCKAQVSEISEHARTFNELKTAVLPILPEPRERAEQWREKVVEDFPFPLLADGEKRVAEQYDQPTRYGPVGNLHDLLGRLPQSVVLDTRGDAVEVIFTHQGDSIDDRPAAAELIGTVEDIQESFVFDCSLVEC